MVGDIMAFLLALSLKFRGAAIQFQCRYMKWREQSELNLQAP